MRRLKRMQRQNREWLIEDLIESTMYTTCPFYRNKGLCSFGCYSEPACITGQPWRRLSRGETKYIRKYDKWYEHQLKLKLDKYNA